MLSHITVRFQFCGISLLKTHMGMTARRIQTFGRVVFLLWSCELSITDEFEPLLQAQALKQEVMIKDKGAKCNKMEVHQIFSEYK